MAKKIINIDFMDVKSINKAEIAKDKLELGGCCLSKQTSAGFDKVKMEFTKYDVSKAQILKKMRKFGL